MNCVFSKIKLQFGNVLYNIPLLISALALLVLNIKTATSFIVCAGIFVIITVISSFKKHSFSYIQNNKSILALLYGLAISGSFALIYYRDMRYSSKIDTLSNLIGINSNILVLILSAIGFIASLYFTTYVSTFFTSYKYFSNCSSSVKKTKLSSFELLVCLFTAVGVIAVCSKSSPLYPFNDWVDSNCFFTVGKSMLSGVVPYKDLVEQKGPLLYMLHTIAAAISYETFLGVYIIEVIAAFSFLVICRKIFKLFNPDASVFWLPLMAAAIYSANHFCHGDSAEELCMPLLVYSLYVGLKAIINKQEISFWEGFLIGVTSACVLWIKYTFLGIYIGWIFGFAIIKIMEKRFISVLKLIPSILLGIVTLTLPIFIYFIKNNALSDLFTVYFYNNIFIYPSNIQGTFLVKSIKSVLIGFGSLIKNNLYVFILIAFGMLCILASKRIKESVFLFSSLAFLFIFVYIGGVKFSYYSMILSVFIPFGFIVLSNFINDIFKSKQNKNVIKAVACCISLILTVLICFTNNNVYMLKVKKQELPQYQFAEIILKEENPTLLNYGFLDGGFYTTTGIVPNCPYFCTLNAPLEDMKKTQQRFIDEGLVDFVVTRGEKLSVENYKCVKECTFVFEEQDRNYYLYQLISEE